MSAVLDTLRTPPQSVEAEQSVLGGLMLAPESLAKIADWLHEADFYRRDHRLIYRAILELARKSQPFDAVTMGEWLEANCLTEQVGGTGYLIELASTTPSAANIVAYAEIVKEHGRLREAINIGTALVNDGFQPEGRSAEEIVAAANHALSELRTDNRAGGLTPAGDRLNEWFHDLQHRYERGSGVTGIPYPWFEVNRVTHGLQRGELTIIAARPSMGKSIMGLNIAKFSALRKVNTAFFSLEMTARQVNRRNVSDLSGVPHDWLLAPDKDHDEYWSDVSEAVSKLRQSSLLVDESAGLKIEQLVARARRAHMRKPLELIVVDHLHEMAFRPEQVRHDIGNAVGSLKALGKEFDCPVVVLAQLNRGVETRQDKRPSMADLRESGEIEQKADVIWFLYREDYYRRNDVGFKPQHDVELILGKGRDLQVGKPIILRDEFHVMRMVDWTGDLPQRGEVVKQAKGFS